MKNTFEIWLQTNRFFSKSYKKYLHLGAKFNDNPILVNLNDIIQIDEIFNSKEKEILTV